ncbi:NADPH-dependent 7-cyano-7-deazaguanine reductase QueF [Ornithinibacillus gellani]|uniref:preQ(1) synthase n=1 Tax=Ornithinibacillus gellani TaxID=2293253 RepID=UPI000F47F08C|nr:preQ(1) synthase [Ornithinibacillus gellani]TQS74908.1 NADPH-dependent 7-cyano-7-deazaguanine reductase QueF [Ornithinibacillus gellani]
MSKKDIGKDLTLLGKEATYTFQYNPDILEAVENDYPDRDYFVKCNCPEFTTLCPVTGQPDFAAIYIAYIPDEKIIESKALKLYLFSFRNEGGFHEAGMNRIMDDLIKVIEPRYIEVWGRFMPRGGISIDPYCNYGKPGTKYEDMAVHRMMNHDMHPENIHNR